MLSRLALGLFKVETVYGTDPVPTPALNAILIYDLTMTVDGRLLTRQSMDASLSRRAHIMGRKLVNLTFRTEITVSTKVSYNPISSSFESVTAYIYWDGLLTKIGGLFFDWELNAAAGEFGSIQWRGQGLYADPTDVAIPAGAVFQTTKPPMIQSSVLTLGAYATGVIQALQLRGGNQLSERPDLNSPEGFKGTLFTGREITGSINPEAVTEATHSFWANFKAGTEVAMTATFGSVAGNRIKINTAPKVQYGPPALGDRNGIRTYDVPIFLNRSVATGNDELIIDCD
jgi:Phage tail tube protein